VTLPERPQLLNGDPHLSSERVSIRHNDYFIETPVVNLNTPEAGSIELNEQELLCELNKQL
jgi:hypothetical protein